MKRYKIFAITNSWPPIASGHGRFFFQLLKNYNNKIVLAPKIDSTEKSDEVLHLLKFSSPSNPSKFKSILQHLEILIKPLFIIRHLKERPKVTMASQVLFSGLACYIIMLIFGIPYIIVAHGEEYSIYYNSKLRIKYYLARIVSQRACMIVCNAYNTSQILEKHYNIDISKMTVIHPIVDINETKINYDVANAIKQEKYPNKKIILMTGRLYEERKGFDTAIEAFANVKKLYPEVSLVLIGPGQNNKIIELIEKNNLTDDVHLLGKVERNVLLQYFAICDMFLMPNRTLKNGDMEGFGIVFLEANMFSKPVIGGRSGGVSDAIEDMVSGILINGDKIEEVEESILKLLLDDKLRHSLGVSAYHRILSRFNEQTQSNKFQNILNQIIS